MSNLDTLQAALKRQIVESLDTAFRSLDEKLLPESEKFNEFIQINGRYRNLLREVVGGTLKPEQVDVTRNQIIQSLLYFIDSLQVDDLKPEADAAPAPAKRGEILYHIPDKMQLNREAKCTVRIAWLLEQLMRDWKKTDVDVVKEIRVAEIMGVQILNVDESQPFAIRTLTESIQFLDKEDFTEWIFYVKALRAGEFSLALRVSVIEMINGKEYKKDIVMEEAIVVVAEEVPTGAEKFSHLSDQVVMGEASKSTRTTPGTPPQSRPQPEFSPAEPASAPSEKRGVSGVASAILAVAAMAALGVFFGVPMWKENGDWNKARRGNATADYKIYLEKHPDGKHSEAAKAALDSLVADSIRQNTPFIPAPDSVLLPVPENPTLVDTAKLPPEPVKPTPGNPTKPQPRPVPNKPPTTAPPKPGTGTSPTAQKPGNSSAQSEPAAPVNPSDLKGRVFYFKVKPLQIVDEEEQKFSLLFYKFNEDREIRMVLYSTGTPIHVGDEVALVAADGKAIANPFLYVATFPDRKNMSGGYFGLRAAALETLAANKIKSLRVTDKQSGKAQMFNLSRRVSKDLNQLAKESLAKMQANGQ